MVGEWGIVCYKPRAESVSEVWTEVAREGGSCSPLERMKGWSQHLRPMGKKIVGQGQESHVKPGRALPHTTAEGLRLEWQLGTDMTETWEL